jgi:hypothetical protein
VVTDVAVRNVPPFIKWMMVVTALTIGIGYLVSPDSASNAPVLTYAQTLFPVQVWGALFMTSGILIVSTRLIGHGLAIVLWGTWGASIWIAYAAGLGTAWDDVVWPMTFVALNGYEVFRWGQKQLADFRRRSAGGR